MSDQTLSSSCSRREPDWSCGSFTPVLMTLAGMAVGLLSLPTARPTSRYLTRPILPRPTGRARNSPATVTVSPTVILLTMAMARLIIGTSPIHMRSNSSQSIVYLPSFTQLHNVKHLFIHHICYLI